MRVSEIAQQYEGMPDIGNQRDPAFRARVLQQNNAVEAEQKKRKEERKEARKRRRFDNRIKRKTNKGTYYEKGM